MEKYLSIIQQGIVTVVIFLFPLFFLTTTQDFFQTNKFYFLALGVIASFIVWSIRVVFDKKLTVRFSLINGALLLFLVTQALSLMFASPNKIASLIAIPGGFGALFIFTLFFFVLTLQTEEASMKIYWKALRVSALISALISIVFFFNPFRAVTIPPSFQFLKNPTFNTLGNPIEMLLFLGFFLVYEAVFLGQHISKKATNYTKKELPFGIILFVSVLVAVLLNLVFIVIPQKIGVAPTRLPPFSVSWYGAVETLKNPMTALFGVGVDNFTAIFTRVKPIEYNATDLWQFNFTRASTFFLHLWTETGLAGLLSFILILIVGFKELMQSQKEKGTWAQLASFVYLIIALVLFPISLIVLFMLMLKLASIVINSKNTREKQLPMSTFAPVYIGVPIITIILSLGIIFGFGKAYAGEYYFNQAIVGLNKGDGQAAYNNLVSAIQSNPYSETYHMVFSQLNLLIANNIAARATVDKDGVAQLSDQERQLITQTIQQAIVEAKKVVQLNGEKEQGWENLALIYRSILNAAQGADAWTVAAYQKAISVDPVNPTLRLNLGGVYYSLQNYVAAAQMFNQAIGLKSDWANAHYNLAWALYQNGNYPEAVGEMENVVRLIQKDNPDYKKAQNDLAEFKKKLPKAAPAASGEGSLQPSEQQPLSLPTPPEPQVSPKLNLPEGAEPPTTPIQPSPSSEATPEGQTQQ